MKGIRACSMLILVLLGVWTLPVGCGGGGGEGSAPTYSISGTVSGAITDGVTIILTGAGSATTSTNTGGNYSFSGLVNGTYTVTPSLPGYTFTPSSAAITVSGTNVTGTNFVAAPPSGSNVQSIAVNGGPAASSIFYPNAAFTSVTVCLHGTATCQTIDGVLVDTGSFGLRLLSSALSSTLYKTPTAGTNLGECIQFADGSYVWGPVQTFDVRLAGELASSVPIHILDHSFYTIPSDCSSGGGQEEDDLLSLGANGILGIGPIQYDCGSACNSVASFPTGLVYPYYECSSLGCQAASVNLSQQVQNPVALFSTDKNGVIIVLPAVSGPTASLNGLMVFGIGTQSNNALGSATVLTLNQYASITTIYKGISMPLSFIDSGSNGYFFPDTNIPQNIYGWYIPATTLNLTATNGGYNGKSSNVSFSVGNADNMFSANPNDAVFNTLAGYTSGYFDWGLPFFYGRNIYTAITPDGNGSYWAY